MFYLSQLPLTPAVWGVRIHAHTCAHTLTYILILSHTHTHIYCWQRHLLAGIFLCLVGGPLLPEASHLLLCIVLS